MNSNLDIVTTLVFEITGINTTRFYLAGGCVRDNLCDDEPKDYDVYFTDEFYASKLVRIVKKNISNFKLLAITNNAITVDIEGYKIQFIVHPKLVGDPLTVIGKFDFTCCQAYYYMGKITTSFSYINLKNKKELIFNYKSSYLQSFRSMLRMFSFMKRGYQISIYNFLLVIVLGTINGVKELFTSPKSFVRSIRSTTRY